MHSLILSIPFDRRNNFLSKFYSFNYIPENMNLQSIDRGSSAGNCDKTFD